MNLIEITKLLRPICNEIYNSPEINYPEAKKIMKMLLDTIQILNSYTNQNHL